MQLHCLPDGYSDATFANCQLIKLKGKILWNVQKKTQLFSTSLSSSTALIIFFYCNNRLEDTQHNNKNKKRNMTFFSLLWLHNFSFWFFFLQRRKCGLVWGLIQSLNKCLDSFLMFSLNEQKKVYFSFCCVILHVVQSFSVLLNNNDWFSCS